MSSFLKVVGLLVLFGILTVVVIIAGAIIAAMVSLFFPLVILFTVGWFMWMCFEEHKKETKGSEKPRK